ncbi:MAG: type II 3-dehydroquinate dehydratase [Bacillota bacterium]|jgi:3-dehydroquinate dehydratase-2
MSKILLIHGPNLNMLGIRERSIYGDLTLDEINAMIESKAASLGLTVEIHQSNHEGVIIDIIHSAYGRLDGIIINPGAYTHYSYAIADAIASVSLPTIEVHLSDINKREEFRRHSVIKAVALEQISGLGARSYLIAMEKMAQILK